MGEGRGEGGMRFIDFADESSFIGSVPLNEVGFEARLRS